MNQQIQTRWYDTYVTYQHSASADPNVRRTERNFAERENITQVHTLISFFFLWRCDPTRVMASSFLRFLDHTQRRTTVGRTPLDEWSARRRDLYLATHNTHNRQISMPPVGLEPTISANERPLTHALDRAATGTSTPFLLTSFICQLHVYKGRHQFRQRMIFRGGSLFCFDNKKIRWKFIT